MSLFRSSVPAPRVEQRRLVPIAGGGFMFAGSMDYRETNPMRSVAHWAARRVLCTAVAGLPVDQIRKRAGRSYEVEPSLIVAAPSAQVDQQAWVYQLVDSALDVGNWYGDVVSADSMGFPTCVEILPPGSVSWRPEGAGLVPWVNQKRRDVWPRGDLWHVAYIPTAGQVVGLSPSEAAEQSVSTSQAAEKFGSDYFHASGHPTYDVSVNADISADQAHEIKAGFLRSVRNREPWVHGQTIDAKAMPADVASSGFIDLLRFEAEQAARVYGVPPKMIYAAVSGQSVTYANASQDDLQFLKWSLRWPLTRIERTWSTFLPKQDTVRFNRDALLEMTALERAQVNEIRLRTKTTAVNRVLAKEDELPFDDPAFDLAGIPGEFVPIKALTGVQSDGGGVK